MVTGHKNAYLFLGEDSIKDGLSVKSTKLEKIKEKLSQKTRLLNIDTVYLQDKDFDLRGLQEKLLSIPLPGMKRLIIIHGLEHAKLPTRKFLLSYLANPTPDTILVLDADFFDPNDEFIKQLFLFCEIHRFNLQIPETAFTLSYMIKRRQTKAALELLNRLIVEGEKPERIIGALRVGLNRRITSSLRLTQMLRLLLQTDLEIKTGRLKAAYALEKMIISLCQF
ncbi:MAG: hypothetical protein N2606_03510 [Candidatus Omnitrophica bacterium]|nr:hypothetical protein [Candidatus Omnitrophota bacterium]